MTVICTTMTEYSEGVSHSVVEECMQSHNIL